MAVGELIRRGIVCPANYEIRFGPALRTRTLRKLLLSYGTSYVKSTPETLPVAAAPTERMPVSDRLIPAGSGAPRLSSPNLPPRATLGGSVLDRSNEPPTGSAGIRGIQETWFEGLSLSFDAATEVRRGGAAWQFVPMPMAAKAATASPCSINWRRSGFILPFSETGRRECICLHATRGCARRDGASARSIIKCTADAGGQLPCGVETPRCSQQIV